MRNTGLKRSILPLALAASVMLLSCRTSGSDKAPEDDSSPAAVYGSLAVYGLDIKLSGATLKHYSDQRQATIEEFEYTHSYDKAGEKVTNTLTGRRAGRDMVNYGYHTLTLYEPGIGYDDLSQNISGSGAVVTFHIFGEPGVTVPTGKLVSSKDPVPGTFKAYYSSSYDASDPDLTRIASAKSATLDLTIISGGKVKVAFTLEMVSGTIVSGTYEGTCKELDGPNVAFSQGEGIIIRGYTPKYLLQIEKDGVIAQQAEQPSGAVLQSLLNTGKGESVTGAQAVEAPELVDVMLLKNKETGDFTFVSPVKNPLADQQYVWGKGWFPIYRYFPNTTYFQEAPSDFTDQSYRDLDTKGFNFEVRKDESLRISPDYRGYILFSTTQGMKGVVKVVDYAKPEVIRKLYYGTTYQLYHVTDGFVIDYKVEAVPVIPLIG